MNAGDDARSGEVLYSRGRNTYDAWPEQRSAVSFEAFADAVLRDRSRAKGEAWISAPFKPNSDGRHHRCREGALPRRFLALDLDGSTPNAFAELCMHLGAYHGCGYTTASHTAKNPHARFILELSRSVDRTEGIRLGEALSAAAGARLGTRAIRLDPSVFRAEQPIFTPLVGADVMRYGGHPVDVDEVLKDVPPLKEMPGRAERAAAIASSDPIVRALADRKMIKRDHGDGKLSVACPFEAEHTGPGGDSSTIYLLPNFGGVRYGKFDCKHTHCAQRKQEDFIRALQIDPRDVWREQRGDDLPPVEAYVGDAAREEVRQHTEGAKAPGGGGHRSDNGAGAEDFETRVILTRGNALSVKPIRWTWVGYLARGKLHVLAGAIGTGKSTIAIDFAAVVTTGGRWPDGTKCDPGDVLVWSDEDDPEDTLLPRFLAAGGDPRRIHFVTGTVDRDGKRHFEPATDIPALIAEARNITDLGLVIVDPVVTVVAGDSHKNTEVRRALRPLVGLASDLVSAVLGVSHHTKGTAGRDPVERITGSLAFGALPRVTMAAARDGTDTERRIFCRTKSNIGPDGGGWEYRLELADVPGVEGVRVVVARWGKVLEGSARDLLAEAEATEDPEERGKQDEERGKLDEAVEWLGELLKGGSVNSDEIPPAAKQSGIAWVTVRRAKTLLGVTSRKRDYAAGWWWSLPEHTPPKHDTDEHLGKPTPLKPSCGAGSTEGAQPLKEPPPPTPLKPSCGAGSTEGAQPAEKNESDEHLRSNLGVARVPGVSSPPGRDGVEHLRSNLAVVRVPGDREAEDAHARQFVGVDSTAGAPQHEPTAEEGEAVEDELVDPEDLAAVGGAFIDPSLETDSDRAWLRWLSHEVLPTIHRTGSYKGQPPHWLGPPPAWLADFTGGTCPRCDGEGCDWCGGLGRLVDDQPEEPAA